MAADRHRVLLTADTVGGVWQYALELAQGLSTCGDQVALATMGGPLTQEQRRDAEAIDGLSLYPSNHKLAWMQSPWVDVDRAGDWLLEVAAQVQPSVVHLNDYSHGDLPWDAPVLMTGHSCVLSWWQAVHGSPAPRADWDRYRSRVHDGLHAADLVVAPSQAMLTALISHYGPLPSARVIANGRSRHALVTGPDREPLILAAGRLWDEGKNIVALAEVAPRLPWPVCVAGQAHHPDGGTTQLPNVRLLGCLDSAELDRWFARAAIYALPARYEPFGLSALEAAQAGCALVLGDIDSLREVWGDAALFVAPDDRDALAATLQRLIDDASLREDYARRARLRAARYTPAAMVNGYRRAYSGLSLQRGLERWVPPRTARDFSAGAAR
ncbi:glycosyltransferase family 4 protein [Lysobacter sp. D1-1-M9]|uniref:glycosyltransferase family 4 protein n=1 Tax=Novilysobacter longmucuonensis TaxID=3098603 RepID=UPI002FC888AC